VKDRLEPGALDAITTKYASGTRQVDLAADYGISLSSVKRILRRAR
jgi:DNA-binding transcriptional regulator LsrR (DeoR family)